MTISPAVYLALLGVLLLVNAALIVMLCIKIVQHWRRWRQPRRVFSGRGFVTVSERRSPGRLDAELRIERCRFGDYPEDRHP